MRCSVKRTTPTQCQACRTLRARVKAPASSWGRGRRLSPPRSAGTPPRCAAPSRGRPRRSARLVELFARELRRRLLLGGEGGGFRLLEALELLLDALLL